MTALTRIVGWAHDLLAETLSPGQLAVDLTAGNGHDTLELLKLVGPEGQVIAFDVQPEALTKTRERLMAHGGHVRMCLADGDYIPRSAGIDLVAAGHERLKDFLPAAPQAIIANLGYLPGGDQALITQPDTTLEALKQGCELLHPGGRLGVVIYPGHPGGREEGLAVESLLSGLDEQLFQVLQLKVANRQQAPYLLVVEKRQTAAIDQCFRRESKDVS